ncbi:MAG: type III-A CRISPR-associated protein Csm2 [Anaerolineae bacterium]|nr:type III-A CRISPR-associated protein Csm2 [Anaerolineae bacterium]
MTITTIPDLEKKLKDEKGPLSAILSPQDFADEGAVADVMAQKFKKDLNPTQMRKVFHAFKQIERKLKGKPDGDNLDGFRAEISLITPNLAYAVGRKLMPPEFYDVLKLCLKPDKLQTVGDFRRLTEFLTAILAYQKYYSKGD